MSGVRREIFDITKVYSRDLYKVKSAKKVVRKEEDQPTSRFPQTTYLAEPCCVSEKSRPSYILLTVLKIIVKGVMSWRPPSGSRIDDPLFTLVKNSVSHRLCDAHRK